MNDTADVVIAGGGILGTSLGHAMVERGGRVVLLEAGTLAGETSAKTFAWLNATSKHQDETYHRLNAAGMAHYRDLAREWGEDRIGLTGGGMLAWNSGRDRDQRAALETQYDRLTDYGYPVRWLNGRDLEALEPHVRFPEDAEGLFAIADAWLDGTRAVRFLAERMRALGGEVREGCRLTGVQRDASGKVVKALTDNGDIATATVVLATGAVTAALLNDLVDHGSEAPPLPISRVKGLLVETPDLSPWRRLRCVHYTTAFGELHMRPAGKGALLLGAEDVDEEVPESEPEKKLLTCAETLLARAREYLPGLPGNLAAADCTRRVGIRPIPADGRPIVGPVPESPGLYVMITHSGMTLGPLLGELLAEEIARGSMPEMLAPYRYERFRGNSHNCIDTAMV